MNAVTQFHFLVGAIACLVGVVTTLFFAKRFTKPIIEISQATEGLSQLEFQQQITYSSPDELGHLASSINRLSRKLEENRSALKNEIAFQKVLSQNMSHELKTPISVMKGYLEGITLGVAESEAEKDEYLQIVLSECDRMTDLINRMLQLSKLTSFQEQGLEQDWFTGEEFSSQLQDHWEALLRQQGLTLALEVTSLNCYGNQELLLQGVGNFISNAVKYGDNGQLRLILKQENQVQLFSLYNSGSVLPEAERGRVFDVFYRIDKVRGRETNSHGLGLSVCKTIAELHGGEAFCAPLEQGMVFTLKIPLGDELPPTTTSGK